MTSRHGCFARQTAKNSQKNEIIPLFFRAPNRRLSRISAEDEMSMADNSLQKTAKTASSHRAAAKRNRRPRESGGPEPPPGLNRGPLASTPPLLGWTAPYGIECARL